MIKKVGVEFCVFSKDGKKNLGCHPTEEEAKKHLAAIEAAKHAKKELDPAAEGRRVVQAEVRQIGAPEDRVLELIGSDETPDSYDTILKTDGWDMADYNRNPVFLWCHDTHSLPIGQAVGTEIKARSDGKPALAFRIKFATVEENPFADLVYRQYQKGFLRAASVGFQNIGRIAVEGEEATKLGFPKGRGEIYTKNRLKELSAVPVPANPNALQLSLLEACPIEKREALGLRVSADLETLSPEAQGEWFAEKFEAIRKLLAAGPPEPEEKVGEVEALLRGDVRWDITDHSTATITAPTKITFIRAADPDVMASALADMKAALASCETACAAMEAAMGGEKDDAEKTASDGLAARPLGIEGQLHCFLDLFENFADKTDLARVEATVTLLRKEIDGLRERTPSGSNAPKEDGELVKQLVKENLGNARKFADLYGGL